MTNILLDRIFNKGIFKNDDSIEIIASRKDTSRVLNEKFKTYLINQISENHNANITVSIKTPSQEHVLQAVDYISWSIFRKYELRDEEYYQIIKERIIEENSIMP